MAQYQHEHVEVQSQSQTGAAALTPYDTGKHIHNAGATAGPTVYELPASSSGMTYRFTDEVGCGVAVRAPAGEFIHYLTNVSPAAGLATIGNQGTVEIACLVKGHWHVVELLGTCTLSA